MSANKNNLGPYDKYQPGMAGTVHDTVPGASQPDTPIGGNCLIHGQGVGPDGEIFYAGTLPDGITPCSIRVRPADGIAPQPGRPVDVTNVPSPISPAIGTIKKCTQKFYYKRNFFSMMNPGDTLVGANDLRVAVIFHSASGQYNVDTVPATGFAGQGLNVYYQAPPLMLTWDKWGPLVQAAWYVSGPGISNVVAYELIANY